MKYTLPIKTEIAESIQEALNQTEGLAALIKPENFLGSITKNLDLKIEESELNDPNSRDCLAKNVVTDIKEEPKEELKADFSGESNAEVELTLTIKKAEPDTQNYTEENSNSLNLYGVIINELERDPEVQVRGRGQPIAKKDYSHPKLVQDIIPKLAKLLDKIKLTRSGKGKRKRSDAEFYKIVCFIKKIPNIFCKNLHTSKFYKMNYENSKVKTIRHFCEAFKGFLNFMHPITDCPMKFSLFLDFICIYFTNKKILPLYADLRKERSITQQKYKDLLEYTNNRRESSKEINTKLFQKNQSLRI